MIAIFSLLLVLVLSLLITRIATIALTYTGMSRQSAKFQARSAFTGVGFTTSESEKVVNHPVRRRILLMMMLIGNTELKPSETLILYGRNSDIARLDRRQKGPGGNIQHAEAVAAQKIKKKDEE